MSDAARTRSLFADALEIPAKLESDRLTPYEERAHRDREIAVAIDASDALVSLREWDRRTPSILVPPDDVRLTERLVHARRLISIAMVLLGVMAGIGASLAVFRYDGTWPVNIVTVLATLVLLQLLLIGFTVLLMIPRAPGLAVIQDLLAGFNPGALVASVYRRLGRLDHAGANLLAWNEARGPAAAGFARWQMIAWSQTAAVAFNLAALATAAALIAFTDLAFGWSTTLQVSSDRAWYLTNALAAPWRTLWPIAVPSPELIEASRFFRLASAAPNAAPATQLTGWWPFLLASIVTYALIPRCLLAIFAAVRLHRATERLLLDDPRVRALLDRMQTADVRLGATDAEFAGVASAMEAARAPAIDAGTVAIVWSGALPIERASAWSEARLQRRVLETFEAGSGALDEDRATIARVAEHSVGAVLIFVRAWEAPLLDLKDFLVALRERLGAASAIVIAPVQESGERASEAQRAVWSRWVARAGDAALYVESGA